MVQLFKATTEPILFPFCIIPAKMDFLQLFLNSSLHGTISNIKPVILKYMSHIFKEETEKFPSILCISLGENCWTGHPAMPLGRPAKERLMGRSKEETREEVGLHNTKKTHGIAADLSLQVRGQGDFETLQSVALSLLVMTPWGVEQPFMVSRIRYPA